MGSNMPATPPYPRKKSNIFKNIK